jgi:hypothetical protein
MNHISLKYRFTHNYHRPEPKCLIYFIKIRDLPRDCQGRDREIAAWRNKNMHSKILFLDGIINLALGLPLMFVPGTVATVLGLPTPASGFYPAILGAVLTGIGIALLIQVFPRPSPVTGLGLEGAVCINLLGAGALAGWLWFGNLQIPPRGRIFLWAVAVAVLCLSLFELLARGNNRRKLQPPDTGL